LAAPAQTRSLVGNQGGANSARNVIANVPPQHETDSLGEVPGSNNPIIAAQPDQQSFLQSTNRPGQISTGMEHIHDTKGDNHQVFDSTDQTAKSVNPNTGAQDEFQM